jgi:hypothetical protein
MISLKRLAAMRRWQAERGTGFEAHASWGFAACLLRFGESHPLVPTERLAPAIAKAEAEHARHRTVERRERARREADYRYLLYLAECRLAAKERK